MIGRNVLRRCTSLLSIAAAVLLGTDSAHGFPLVVQPGDTLAGIAQRIYGRADYESLLVTANALDAHGGVAIAPGMRLEIPALSHRRVTSGDTWATLAASLLGSPVRAAVLSFSNDSNPWTRPAENAEIAVPYNVRFVAQGGENLSDLGERFLGRKNRGWMLATYNGLTDVVLRPGQLVLLPITELKLTEAGRQAARRSRETWGDVSGERHAAQAAAARELPALLAEVRGGRYADAVARGLGLLGGSALSTPQRASVYRQLLEAYAALGATGRAADACREWRRAAPRVQLDPVALSPKLLAACERPRE